MWVDRGGAWIGPGQERIYTLMNEFGVSEYKQYNDGEAMMIVDGKKHRYGGTIPWTMSPWAVANLGVGLLQAEQMCKSLPRDAPWQAKKAVEWDRISVAEWLEKSVMSKQAREMLDTALAGPYTTAASETSLLWMLLQQGSAGSPTIGGPTFVISGEGGAQDARPVGGMGAIYRPMVAELGDALHLSQPVRRIAQDDDGVTIRSDDLTVRARRAIVAIPFGDRKHDQLRADAAGGPLTTASADARRRGHQDLRLLRRAFLAHRRAVRPVGRARNRGHPDHRCLHGHRGTGGHVCDHRRACRT